MKKILCFLFILSASFAGHGQSGLEDVIIETYYVSDANDRTDQLGGNLAEGSVTYRIYVDLAPNWKLQTVFGSSAHELFIATTTEFLSSIAPCNRP